MAKSKSTDGAGEKAKKPAPKTAAKSKAPAKSKGTGPAIAPQIDTALAAQTAAKMIGAKLAVSPAATGEARESAAFKNLKQNLNQPHSAALSNLLDKTGGAGQRRPNLPAFGNTQANRNVSHNQTFGADVNRAGVPRRTGG